MWKIINRHGSNRFFYRTYTFAPICNLEQKLLNQPNLLPFSYNSSTSCPSYSLFTIRSKKNQARKSDELLNNFHSIGCLKSSMNNGQKIIIHPPIRYAWPALAAPAAKSWRNSNAKLSRKFMPIRGERKGAMPNCRARAPSLTVLSAVNLRPRYIHYTAQRIFYFIFVSSLYARETTTTTTNGIPHTEPANISMHISMCILRGSAHRRAFVRLSIQATALFA